MRPTTSHLNSTTIARDWHVVDAEGVTLGHMATEIAMVLMGKHKPTVSEHYDCGDNIIVVNAAKVRVSGTKAENKVYVHHTGYPGGQREVPFAKLLDEKPEEIVIKAVKRMMPKNKLGRHMLSKLHVYGGAEHPHAAQQPQALSIN
ncbi:MAG: 50S ribosomal protein L13 [Planctomycetes bacterium]|nr:50S ribosomal protein L13 [Planctomycetota bacterium]